MPRDSLKISLPAVADVTVDAPSSMMIIEIGHIAKWDSTLSGWRGPVNWQICVEPRISLWRDVSLVNNYTKSA